MTHSLNTGLALVGDTIAPILIDAGIKGMVLAAIGLLICAALRRSSSSIRYSVLGVTILGVLVLPVFSAAPHWRVLPSWLDASHWTGPQAAADTPLSAPRTAPPSQSGGPAAVSTPPPGPDPAGPVPPVGPTPQTEDRTELTQQPPEPSAGENTAAATTWDRFDWRLGIAWGWLIGAGGLMLWIALGVLAAWRAGARLPVVREGPVFDAMRRAAGDLRLDWMPRILLSDRHTMPMTWGIRRPTVLLPAEARQWDGPRLRIVMLHELAHIIRQDNLTQFITQCARALHWFNPLVWVIHRRMMLEREQACDDLVVTVDRQPADYAEQLLSIAVNLQGKFRTPHAAIAMARKSTLEGRLMSVLDEKRNRRRLAGWTSVAVAVVSMAIVLPLGLLGPDRGASAHPIGRTGDAGEYATLQKMVGRWVIDAGRSKGSGNVRRLQIGADGSCIRHESAADGSGAKTFNDRLALKNKKLTVSGYWGSQDFSVTVQGDVMTWNEANGPVVAVFTRDKTAGDPTANGLPGRPPRNVPRIDPAEAMDIMNDSLGPALELLFTQVSDEVIDRKDVEAGYKLYLQGKGTIESLYQLMDAAGVGHINAQMKPFVDAVEKALKKKDHAAAVVALKNFGRAKDGFAQLIVGALTARRIAESGTPDPSAKGNTGRPIPVDLDASVAMLGPMKAMFGALHHAVVEKKDAAAGLKILQTAMPQFNQFKAMVEGTPIAPAVRAGIAQIQAAEKALKAGDLATAQTWIGALSHLGKKMEEDIRRHAKEQAGAARRRVLPPYVGTWSILADGGKGIMVVQANGVVSAYAADEENGEQQALIEERDGKYVLNHGDDHPYEVTIDGDTMKMFSTDKKGNRGVVAVGTRMQYDPKFVGSWKSVEFTGSVREQFSMIQLDLHTDATFTLTAEGAKAGPAIKSVYGVDGNTIQLMGRKSDLSFIKSARYDNGTIRLVIGDGAAVLRKNGGAAKGALEAHDERKPTVGQDPSGRVE